MSPGEQWGDCPPGLIGSMIERRRRSHQLARLTRAGGAAALAVVLVIGVVTTSRLSEPVAEQLSCSQAAELFAQYRDEQLDNATQEKVRLHLDDCPNCRSRFREEYAPEAHFPADPAASLVLALNRF